MISLVELILPYYDGVEFGKALVNLLYQSIQRFRTFSNVLTTIGTVAD